MTPLGERIAALIAENGPISVSNYMALCLLDPQHGYYTTREPFGAAGDFTTAPEISQMFGELVGVWICSAWQAIGAPPNVAIAEIGPGRGTLMKDVLRTLGRLAPDLAQSARFCLVEASDRLMGAQRDTLAGSAVRLEWHKAVADLAAGPFIVVGNEIFDALPVRQFVRAENGWRERMIGLDAAGELAFVAGPATIEAAYLPEGAETAPEGTIFEVPPARTALMQEIAERIAADGGAGLFFDYGHLEPGFGDTLQAVRRHCPEGVLENPGEADLTSHVDFSALSAVARAEGLETKVATQGDFLLAFGLLERAGRLGAGLDEAGRERVHGEVERLAGPDAMGTLFKVIAVARPGTRLAGFSG